jgi:Ser-tRNA(Ala) deacylase AlaX
MTERLYYTNAYQQEFDATVVALTTVADHPAVVLDQTYFYPTSGPLNT